MTDVMMLFTYILGAIVIGFILIGIDKRKAVNQKYRIPERTFWGIAVLGGALGILIGMYVFRHKIHKKSFKIGMPLIALLMIGLFYLVYSNL